MKKRPVHIFICIVLALAGVFASPARAQFPDIAQVVRVEILSGWRTAQGQHFAGIRVRLAPGWKTYWRVPGEGGIPPYLDLNGSLNVAAVQLHMPRPRVFDGGGLVSIGYTDEVVMPIELTAREAGAEITLRGALHIGVCEAVCIPVEVPLDVRLGASGRPGGPIAAALEQRPQRSSVQPGCRITPLEGRLQLELSIPVLAHPDEYPVVETVNPEVWVAPSRIWREAGQLHLVADLYPPAGAPYVLDRGGLRVTVLSRGAAVEMTGCVAG